ncbi:MAG: metal ABC transporter permease [Deltaproteobacteria bacterium]
MMNIWYSLVDFLLPFDWTNHIFMKNALLAVILVCPLFGLLGTMIVNNKMAFFSDAIGHSALTGIAIGVLLGLKNPILSMLAFSIILALAISAARNISLNSTDTIIGIFSSAAVALGIVILSKGGGFAKYSSYLIGDLLSISPNDLALLFFVFISVIIIWILIFNKLFLTSISKSLAVSKKVNTVVADTVFTLIVAVIVTISIQWLGILIINSLLVLPSASARNLSSNIKQYHAFSIAISLISGISGLIMSYYWGTATGATIVLVSAVFYIASLVTIRIRN